MALVLRCEYQRKRKEKKKKSAQLCLGRYQDQGEYQLTYAFSGTGTIFRAQSEIITRLASQPTRRGLFFGAKDLHLTYFTL